MSNRGEIQRLVGVYDADGTLRGELTYWFGARLGRTHCALCDITHGTIRERRDWRACRSDLPVPFDVYHRNDQPDPVRAALVATPTPAVLAQTGEGLVVLLGPHELEACEASPEALLAAVVRAASANGLAWPAADL